MAGRQDIQFWQIRKRANRRKPQEVRWRVGTKSFSRSFLTKALAENYRSDLMRAARDGEAFLLATGEPLSWERSAETVLAHARAFMRMRWADGGAPNTRKSLVRGLAPVVLATLDKRAATRNRPAEATLRKALSHWALRPPAWEQSPPEDVAEALTWLAKASRPVADLADVGELRELLGALALNSRTTEPVAHSTMRVRRATLHAFLDHAVERKLLTANPLTGLRTRRRRVSDRIDPRRVPNLEQGRRLLAHIPERGGYLRGFFGVLYYAGTRPAEARALRLADCTLPETGWGSLLLGGSRPEVDEIWTDGGDRFGERELKHRAEGDTRSVPIAPALVAMLREHVKTYGTAPDGRLFWENTESRGPVSGQAYRRVWTATRKAALTEEEQASKLAVRPYDLRHGHASLLLSIGVAPTEVARRLGHSVAMLFTTYAHWLVGLEEQANAQIDRALGGDDTPLTSENDPSGDGPSTGQTGGPEAA
ncbi:tyrosine-type recombinase/integrase [Actinomadura oligospora]|uniref:tyrosine-type recombinase/integrase n=1 Tax=Actinomadura oligospora TaxID=111804 RepID=UPI00047ADE8C|nr:tyrosine-type recombinase/integrase [Actinomadura oligospora]